MIRLADRHKRRRAWRCHLAHTHAYGTIGNRLWSADNLVTNTYAANNLNQYSSIVCGSASPCEPVYDADGNMTSDGTFAYAYDAENRLVSVTSVAETNGAIRILNSYDHYNRRIRKTVDREPHIPS
jgi:YD repeat-containing protein